MEPEPAMMKRDVAQAGREGGQRGARAAAAPRQAATASTVHAERVMVQAECA